MQKTIISVLFLLLISAAITDMPAETIRVLAIGNSFSEDAVENYLYDLGKNEYVPAGLSATDALIAQKTAECAVNSSYSVTDLSEIKQKKI